MNCKYVRWFGEKVLWACPHTLCLLLAAAVLVACRHTRPRLVGATLSLGRAPGFCSCGCSWRAAPPTWADAQAGLGEECYVDETEPMVMVARSEVRFVNVYPSQRVAWSTASPHHNPHGEESTAPVYTLLPALLATPLPATLQRVSVCLHMSLSDVRGWLSGQWRARRRRLLHHRRRAVRGLPDRGQEHCRHVTSYLKPRDPIPQVTSLQEHRRRLTC